MRWQEIVCGDGNVSQGHERGWGYDAVFSWKNYLFSNNVCGLCLFRVSKQDFKTFKSVTTARTKIHKTTKNFPYENVGAK